jgi:predicted DsbA family dithiol-disulfide isomerase
MPVNVKMTSDFICPWCLIGDTRLRKAIETLPDHIEVEVEWLPFELNPTMPANGLSRRLYRTQKFGSWEKSRAMDAQTIEAAKDDGVVMNYDRILKTPNSFNAHRLSWLAAREGKQREIVRRLFEALFTQGHDLGDAEVLAGIAAEEGFERGEILRFLESRHGEREVRALEEAAYRSGVQAVPHFNIEGTIIVGAQRLDVLRGALIDARKGEMVLQA